MAKRDVDHSKNLMGHATQWESVKGGGKKKMEIGDRQRGSIANKPSDSAAKEKQGASSSGA